MYKHILVPVVFDDQHDPEVSFEIARALGDPDAKFTVAHVLETVPAFVAAEIPNEVLMKTHEEAARQLEEVTKKLSGATPKMIAGHVGSSLINYAKENGVDCIVIDSHRPGFSDIFLGSTAGRVVRHASCAVHVIR